MIFRFCRNIGSSAIITKVEQKEKAEKPPTLFDLTSLQREANRQLGFTAQQTLDYTQALYEKKLVIHWRCGHEQEYQSIGTICGNAD